MANKLSLPSSSLNELARIVQGYSHFEDSVTLDDLAQLVGIHRTSVSGNNRFLTEVGLISG